MVSEVGLVTGIVHTTEPRGGRQPSKIAPSDSTRGIPMHAVPEPQSRVSAHRSTQRPRAQVPLRHSASLSHGEPAGRDAFCAVQLARRRPASSVAVPSIWQDSPGAQVTSLLHLSPAWPLASWQ